MKIYILTDNRTKKRGILAEHGLSVFIKHKNINILFDTGQSDIYCRNAIQMGMDLSKADYIVLSHGHYDHCGGLIHFPQTDKTPTIFAHKDAFQKRYVINPNGRSHREIGIPWSLQDSSFISNNLTLTQKAVTIVPDIFLFGEIPSTTLFEGVPEGFFTGEEPNRLADMMADEQMLIFDTDKGLCVFLGCSHPGVVNCLNYALKQFPGKKIDTLVAGMHLDSVSPLRLQMTIQHIIDLGIRKVVPLHCTGIYAITEMMRFLRDKCLPLCAGDTFEI